MAHTLNLFAQFVLFAGGWAIGVGAAFLIAIGTIAAVELWDDRRRARRGSRDQ